MTYRSWSIIGIVIVSIAVSVAIGCGSGKLGVKDSYIKGRIVEQQNPAQAVDNATIRLMASSESSSSDDSNAHTNIKTVLSDADGRFVFEKVRPESFVLEVSKYGFANTIFPQKDSSGGDSKTLESFSIGNGELINLGDIQIERVTDRRAEDRITAKIVFRDSRTLELIDALNPGMMVGVSFNNQVIESSVSAWRQGSNILVPEDVFELIFRVNSELYVAPENMKISGIGNIEVEVFLEPVSYNIMVRCVNVPDYVKGGVVNIFAESSVNTQGMPKVIASYTMGNLGDLEAPNLPEVISLPGLAMPIDLRIEVRGYKDEVVKIQRGVLADGSRGTYRLDIDFLHESNTFKSLDGNEAKLIYHPSSLNNSKAGLYDNMNTRDLVLQVAGPDLAPGTNVEAFISLPYKGNEYYIPSHPTKGIGLSGAAGEAVLVSFPETAVGYNLYYSVTIFDVASGPFVITNAEPVMVNPVSKPGNPAANQLKVVVEAIRP